MITLGFDEITNMVEELSKRSADMRPATLRFFPYLKRVLESGAKTALPKYPLEIKIPKANKYLLKGDYEPEYIIRLESPLTLEDGTPFWFRDSSEGVYLRFGYKNLDAREISDVRFDMNVIHGFLGGSTGHGKSVTMNAIIASICYEYAPWEVELHLSDAKIVEFKRYGIGPHIPHISSIAATEDADYVISVLSKAKQEMLERNKIFGNVGVRDLKSFRKKTGLAYPQVIVIMDEVESTFKLAGKQASKIATLIDEFARLGRSAGYHILMSTQNVTSDIPQSAWGQIRLRCCLGAAEHVSEKVLGNKGAAENMGKIGRLIVNTEVLSGGDTSVHNVKYQTPFLDDEGFEQTLKLLNETGKKLGYKKTLSFYDEEDVRTVEQFDPVIEASFARMKAENEITPTHMPIILGYPSFVSDDVDGLLKIWLDQKDIENIVVTSISSDRAAAHIHNISKSLALNDWFIQLFTTDKEMATWVCNPLTVQEVRSAENGAIPSAVDLVAKRLFLLEAEQLARNANYNRAKVEEMFAQTGIPQKSWGNDLLCRRAVAYQNMIGMQEWKEVARILPSFFDAYQEYEKCNALIKPLTASDFKRAAFIIGDLSKIIGFGRDNKTRPTESFKKAMQDASSVGVLFVLFTRSMENLTPSWTSAIRYAIFDLPDSKDWGRLKVDEPTELKDMLALVSDYMDSTNPQKKFKRTLLKPEF